MKYLSKVVKLIFIRGLRISTAAHLRRHAAATLLLCPLILGARRAGESGDGAAGLALAQTLPSDQRKIVLPGHTITLPEGATLIEAAPELLERPLIITVVLNRSDQKGFDDFVQSVNDPSSELFGHFMSQEQVQTKFGPSTSAYEAVRRYLASADLTVIQDSANRLTVTIKARRSLVERTFGVQFRDYRVGPRVFYATKNDPSVPANIAPYIQAIVGLSNLAVPRPGIILGRTLTNPPALTPVALATAYDFHGTGGGKNQKIGLLEFDAFNPKDLQEWLSAMKIPDTTINRVTTVPVGGGTPIRSIKGEGEVLLDLEILIGMAPAANYSVYEAPDLVSFQDMVNTMINDHVTVISNSWSQCESQSSTTDLDSLESVFKQGLASGISSFNAAGDNGALCPDSNEKEVVSPADVVSAMSVGGTSLSLGAGSSYGGESWWPQGGFGVSAHFPAPAYWKASLPSGVKNRPVPDFVADADERTGIAVYQADRQGWYVAGGTSMAVPIWAAAIALMNEQLGPSGLVISWVAPTQCAKALHVPHSMTGPNNDLLHLGFGSIDLANLIQSKRGCVATH